MPTTYAKPLFHEKTLSRALVEFEFPTDLLNRQIIVAKWIRALERGALDAMKEISLHGDFLRDIFSDVLGYRSVIKGEGEAWTLHAEVHISDGGGSADGALGYFKTKESARGVTHLKGRIIAPIELKGATNNLHRPEAGRKESAVDQGWRYANYTEGCKWVIVSNYRELLLFRTSKTPAFYERFKLRDLVDENTFKRFYFLLNPTNFLPPENRPKSESRLDILLHESDNAEKEITKSLYVEYKNTRMKLVQQLVENPPAGTTKSIMIEVAQKILDRILFISFCEDRGLLPQNTIRLAHDYKDPYNPTSVWVRYKSVFNWIDTGNDDPPIPGYNGGLFKFDPIVDKQIDIPDTLCDELNQLTHYDYDEDVSVEVLGHIFEQSVTDLEELKANIENKDFDINKGQRKTQGVYYTPPLVTQYIVETALGGYLQRKEDELRQRIGLHQIPKAHSRKLAKAELEFWETYRDEVLKNTRVLDPACGSGAFLIAAFDFLLAQYERVNDALAHLKGGQHSLFDLNKTILNNNLYGVDLSKESVEITKLSLWLKTAERGKSLTFLDENIKHGNSIIENAAYTNAPFNWQENFTEVFSDGGFDVLVGNPPYVRQEQLKPIKQYLKEHYRSFDSVADLYTYFYERGVQILKPGGILSFIVTNKWLKAGYGSALRRFFSESSVFEQILDFGHAKIFENADVFPCIVSVRKPLTHEPDASVVVCPVPREKLVDINLKQYVQQHGYEVPWSRFSDKAWSLEHPAIDGLMKKIQRSGQPLSEYLDAKPYYGIKTGFNKAFLIDNETRNRIIKEDSTAEKVIRPYLRGQDIKRWSPEWAGLWLIVMKSSSDFVWPWSGDNGANAENLFATTFPSIYNFFKPFETKLKNRKDKGKNWWELRSCAYYDIFEENSILYQEIQFHPSYCLNELSYFGNNKTFLLPTSDLYILGVLTSPLSWWFNWRYLPHMKDEALSPVAFKMEKFPIPQCTIAVRDQIVELVDPVIKDTKVHQQIQSELFDWLRVEMEIEKPGLKLQNAVSLEWEAFATEVKKRRPKAAGKLSVSGVKDLRHAYMETVPEMQRLKSGILQYEQRIAELANKAYGLTPEEIELIWKTAPPRMPNFKHGSIEAL